MQMSLWWMAMMTLTTCTHCYKILGLFPVPRSNNFMVFEKLMKGLAEKGHHVDVVSHFPRKIPFPRYNDISLKSNLGANEPEQKLSISVVEDYGLFETANFIFKEYGTDLCEKLLNHSAIVGLKKSSAVVHYDLIVAEVFGSDCLLGFSYVFKVPVVGVMSEGMVPWASDRMGNPDNPSYIPNYLLPYTSKMFLWDRIINTFSGLAYKAGHLFMSFMPSELRARSFFGAEMTPLDVLAYNTSLLLVNSHFSSNFPRPMLPTVVEVAGLHIDNPTPLSKTLTKIVQSSNIVIYVEINTDAFSEKQMSDISSCLVNTKYAIVWRADENSNKLLKINANNIYVNDTGYKNVDVLCHSHTSIFITNGDLLRMQEAIHCGVPVIGIPLVAEHEIHVRDHVARGLAVQIKYEHVNQKSLSEAIQTILHNSTYRTNAKFQSQIFRDRPSKPLDTALYWIEYVIRYGGAKHLRSVGADLIWLEYYLIDVALAFIGFVLFIILIFQLIRMMYQLYTAYTQRKLIQLKENSKQE